MTISAETNKVTFAGNGSTTVFASGFEIFDDDDILVEEVNDTTGVITAKTKTTHYTVSTITSPKSAVNITMLTAPASGVTLVLRRNQPLLQSTDYVENDNFPAQTHENNLDKLAMMVQEHEEKLDRAILRNPDLSAPLFLPDLVASKVLAVNSGATAIELTSAAAVSFSSINDLDADTPVSADEFVFYDITGGDANKVTLTNLEAAFTATNMLGYGTGVATFLGTPSSANLASAVTDETGSGSLVFGTSPTLVTPALGTPASGVMTNVTGIPVGALANGTDGELITWGSDAVATTVAAGTSGHVLTSNGAGAAPTFQANATGDALVANPLSQFAATTSSQLAGVISDETGSGALVFGTSPTFVTPVLGTPTSGVMTNVTGTAAGLTAGNVTTNANLTGHVTSVGNAAVLGSFTVGQLNTAVSDDTIAGSATTNTFTNKTIDANNNTLSNIAIGAECTGASTDLTDTSNIAYIDTANVFSQNQEISEATTFLLKLHHDGATSGNAAVLSFAGDDSGANQTDYARLYINVATSTDGAEDGILRWETIRGGTTAVRGEFGDGLKVGSPTGGDKGVGTINATAVYDDNTLLTCYVFDQAVEGAINDTKWDNLTPNRFVNYGNAQDGDDIRETERKHEEMRKFKSRIGSQYDPMDIDKYSQHWKDKKHLTSMPNEVNFDFNDNLSSGEWIQRLIETVEIQAVHIDSLNQRLKQLESK